jgi:hypothetical protein
MAALPEDRPGGQLLLDIARRVLLEELLPLLPEERRLDGLMVANAMGIAGREQEAGAAPLRAALARLAAIYGERVPAELSDAEASDMMQRLDRRLAGDIRAGVFDSGAKRDALLAHLEATTRARVAITNPKILK